MKTWNSNFNEAAVACGLGASDVCAVDKASINGYEWQRVGSKITVAHGHAIWTVEIADIGESQRSGDGS